MDFELKLDFKRGKTGSEIKLNNCGRQKKGTNTKQKVHPSEKYSPQFRESSLFFIITSRTCDPS